mmetsp:Transcript_22389/g.22166  ORF Transcript_22389/g.22166 Transcript_22389/m.22166 type:complete len:80 (-) Transcript_22389:280-519(-)
MQPNPISGRKMTAVDYSKEFDETPSNQYFRFKSNNRYDNESRTPKQCVVNYPQFRSSSTRMGEGYPQSGFGHLPFDTKF